MWICWQDPAAGWKDRACPSLCESTERTYLHSTNSFCTRCARKVPTPPARSPGSYTYNMRAGFHKISKRKKILLRSWKKEYATKKPILVQIYSIRIRISTYNWGVEIAYEFIDFLLLHLCYLHLLFDFSNCSVFGSNVIEVIFHVSVLFVKQIDLIVALDQDFFLFVKSLLQLLDLLHSVLKAGVAVPSFLLGIHSIILQSLHLLFKASTLNCKLLLFA